MSIPKQSIRSSLKIRRCGVNHEEDKKEHELAALSDVIAHTKKKGGEGRRNAMKFIGLSREISERPDIVLRDYNGGIIGIEHFRVDQLVCKNDKCTAKMPELSHYFEKKRIQVMAEDDAGSQQKMMNEIMSEMICKISKISSDATLADLTRSFQKRLFDGDSAHKAKLMAYREHLQKHNPEKIELGYLIEIHADFSGLYLNASKRTKQIGSGEVPLFTNVYEMLERAAQDVDWILLAFCEPVGDEVKNASIVNCHNGMFSKSLARQGFEKTEYLGMREGEPKTRNNSFSAEYRNETDGACVFEVAHKYESASGEATFFQAIEEAARAFELERMGKPFVATLSVQMIYELVRDLAKRCKGRITASTIRRLLGTMSLEEFWERMDAFGNKWGLRM